MGDKELNLTLDYLKKLSNEEFEPLKKNVYEAFSKFSFLFMEARGVNFKRGSLVNLQDRHGPLFSPKDARIIEDLFRGNSNKINSSENSVTINKLFNTIHDYLDDIDHKANTVSRELGVFRFFNKSQFNIPFTIPSGHSTTIIKVPDNSLAIVSLINLIIETIRIIHSLGPNITTQYMPFLLGLIDILKGDWKEGFIGIATFMNTSPLVSELIASVFYRLLQFTIPSLEIPYTSMLPAFCLWGFANFSPESERVLINDKLGSSVDSPIRIFSSSDIQQLKNIQTDIPVIQLISALLE
jgi:hypothetical protein